MEQSKYRDNGSLKISEEVISKIAGLTTNEIKGVAGLSLRPNITDAKFRGILAKNSIGRAIRLEMREGEAVIDVFVNLYLGAKIPEVASEIQSKVKDAIQNMTGITVSKVNVHVSGVIISQQEDERIN
ncbi:MAG: Asp23/Gls24 family envelope stress response protein [Clostridia bacterium]|nr:Asp23/Gls24 family envelope stress response protein [Clostridia bacterium]MDR3645565.1 Asp23/Gls24 family envelope stress response protein [Clostridia bacterium]